MIASEKWDKGKKNYLHLIGFLMLPLVSRMCKVSSIKNRKGFNPFLFNKKKHYADSIDRKQEYIYKKLERESTYT